jgi:hypothetical protein
MKIVFKYTIKMNGDEFPQTHYAYAYTEEIARKALTKHLGVHPKMLRLSKSNPPFLTRKKLMDENDRSLMFTVDCAEKPDKMSSVESRKEKYYDQKRSMRKSIKYKIGALLRQDKKLLLSYSYDLKHINRKKFPGYERHELCDFVSYGENAFSNAYKDLRHSIKKYELGDTMYNEHLTFDEALGMSILMH